MQTQTEFAALDRLDGIVDQLERIANVLGAALIPLSPPRTAYPVTPLDRFEFLDP